MQNLLTNAILFIVIIFPALMVIDFVLGLIHSNTKSTSSTSLRSRPEDVFKIIDELEKPVPTEAGKPVPSTLPHTHAPSPQFSTVGSAAIDYEAMTIRELKGLASSLQIPYYSRLRKAELIETIRQC